jgi:hypothetical protein
LFGRNRFLESFAYHADRGLQVESLAASVLMKLSLIDRIGFGYGAFEVRGRGVELASSLSLPVTGALLLITVLMMYREYRLGRLGVDRFPRYAAALTLAYMLGSKVLSPQYMLWLLPLVPLSAGGFVGIGICLLFLATCWMTWQVLIHYQDLLIIQFPGPELLLGRNLLLVLLWALLLVPHGLVSNREVT